MNQDLGISIARSIGGELAICLNDIAFYSNRRIRSCRGSAHLPTAGTGVRNGDISADGVAVPFHAFIASLAGTIPDNVIKILIPVGRDIIDNAADLTDGS